jgi:hypothetical protein
MSIKMLILGATLSMVFSKYTGLLDVFNCLLDHIVWQVTMISPWRKRDNQHVRQVEPMHPR